MCWDTRVTIGRRRSLAASTVSQVVSFFTKYESDRLRDLCIGVVSPSSLPLLSRLTNLRRLSVSSTTPIDSPFFTAMLHSLGQLEYLYADLRCSSFEFPYMPLLQSVVLHCYDGQSVCVVNMDSAHLPRLSHLTITCSGVLQVASFPSSLTRLWLHGGPCSPQVLAAVAKLPILKWLLLDDQRDSVLSQPDIRFASTLTALDMYGSSQLGSMQARENLRRMTNLTSLSIYLKVGVTVAFAEAIASLPSLTRLSVMGSSNVTQSSSDLAPLRYAASLQKVSIRDTFLPYIASPTLTSLELGCGPSDTSLAPLAACVNLNCLRIYRDLTEQDAQLISCLAKLETLSVHVPSGSAEVDACIMHICRLPRLKSLSVSVSEGRPPLRIGPAALQALVGLSPTLEMLNFHCPHIAEQQAVVLAVSKLTRLYHFYTTAPLTAEQASLLKQSLPKLNDLEFLTYKTVGSVSHSRRSCSCVVL